MKLCLGKKYWGIFLLADGEFLIALEKAGTVWRYDHIDRCPQIKACFEVEDGRIKEEK